MGNASTGPVQYAMAETESEKASGEQFATEEDYNHSPGRLIHHCLPPKATVALQTACDGDNSECSVVPVLVRGVWLEM